jgi:hypothetical protein
LSPSSTSALLIERVEVGASRIEAVVCVPDPAHLRTTAYPGLASRAIALLPGLVRHRCECGSAHGIEAELADTEMAHLLEHVALELAALAGSPRDLRGDTSWDFARDGRGVFHVSLEFDDDLVVLGALTAAAGMVDGLLGRAELPDVATLVEGLRAQRRQEGDV